MAPALLLLALLAGGFRPGEALIERLRDRRRATPLPRARRRACLARGSHSSCAPTGRPARLRAGDAATPFRARSLHLALPRARRRGARLRKKESMRKKRHHGPRGHRRGHAAIATATAFAHTELKSTYPAKGKTATTRISTVSVTFTGRDPQRHDQGHRPRRHGLHRQRRPRPAQGQAPARAAEVVQEGRHLHGQVDDEGLRRPHADRLASSSSSSDPPRPPRHRRADAARRGARRPRTSRSARRSPRPATPCCSR